MITIVSFGFGHAEPPPVAHVTVDVRALYRDPHLDPAMIGLNGTSPVVVGSVMRQPGARRCVERLAYMVCGLATDADPTIAIGCVGGRHRSVVLVDQLAALLRELGWTATVRHRDIDKPVLNGRDREAGVS